VSGQPGDLDDLDDLDDLGDLNAAGPREAGPRIAWLEGRVAALEAALARRSHEMREIQRHLCPRDLARWARAQAGLPIVPRLACQPELWQETCELTEAQVPETMRDLWVTLHPGSAAR
jgi:hypothetical protein